MSQIFPPRPLQGNSFQVTIAQANIAQALKTERSLVRYALIQPDGGNSGAVTMSLGPNPNMPQLELDMRPTGQRPDGGWVDLAQVQIKSTVQGDKVNVQTYYAP